MLELAEGNILMLMGDLKRASCAVTTGIPSHLSRSFSALARSFRRMISWAAFKRGFTGAILAGAAAVEQVLMDRGAIKLAS